jgi:hypothetical protein
MSTQYRRPRSKKRRAPDFETLSRELAGLPVAPPDPLGPHAPRKNTKRYVVERLREPLIEAARRQHTMEGLAAFLGRRGIAIRPEQQARRGWRLPAKPRNPEG